MWTFQNLLQGSHFFPLTKFPDFSSIFFIFPWLLLDIFSCPLFNIYFFMYGLHLLLGNCIKSLDALKYSFYNTQNGNFGIVLVGTIQ